MTRHAENIFTVLAGAAALFVAVVAVMVAAYFALAWIVDLLGW